MIDLTPIMEALISLAATAITVVVIPLIVNKYGSAKLEKAKSWAEIGVKAAEQIYNGPGMGKQKKQYVLEFLRQHGYTVDFGELEAYIESAVNDMKSSQAIMIEEVLENE